MKYIALAWLLGASVARAQPAPLDPKAIPSPETPRAGADKPPEVVLMTFGVGERIFEKFGHAALCLNYENADPVCFNYGVTNFNAGSELVWNFLRTQQRFWVDPESWSTMTYFYKAEDRDIFVQILPLDDAQRAGVERKLLFDIDERNKYYVYDHFFDNCTTRVRDIINEAFGGKLREGADAPYPLTFREIGFRGIAEFPPLKALTDFVLGRQLDDVPTVWEAMFHPTVLREQVAVKLGVKPRQLYKRRGPPFPTDGSTDRLEMFAIALVFALPLLVATWRRKLEALALAWATLYLTVWGLVIWGLVILSSIKGVRWNEAVFVLMPLDALLLLLPPPRRRTYARLRVALLLLVSVLCAIGIFHQPLWIPILTAIMPLAIIAFDLPRPLIKSQ